MAFLIMSGIIIFYIPMALIGHLHHLIGHGLPHHALMRLGRIYDPVLHLKLGQVPAVVISSREACKEVLKDQDPACADRPKSIASKIMWYDYADIIFSPYNDQWRQWRKICILELLSPENVKSFGHIRQDEASRLIKTIHSSSGETVNMTEMLIALSGSVTSRAAFGRVMRDREELTYMMKKGVILASGFELADLFPSFKLLHVLSWNQHKLLRMRRQIDAILDVIMEEHRLKQSGEYGGEDIVDVLLRMQKNRELQFPITNDNIKGVLFAEIREVLKGKETVEDRDLHALKFLKLVIKETLRLHPPSPLLPRACRTECKVMDIQSLSNPKPLSMCTPWEDPEYWHQPEIFLPERFESNSIDFLGNNFEFLPFGAGKRICPGMNFGLATVELPLAQLLYHFDCKMPQGMTPADIDMTKHEGNAMCRNKSLFLVPTVYNPSN